MEQSLQNIFIAIMMLVLNILFNVPRKHKIVNLLFLKIYR